MTLSLAHASEDLIYYQPTTCDPRPRP
ncbi:hypothetical protein CGLO_11171 [Colletotrichum gloeosporioides Cg-14]|uniref:Uncharacterized protein n=1 Tax=Colletotrichum gloeosporioides (strain Cg-14) TaxID=1237896 RepID=T0K1K2_COLGC|nr:hypothetical protein CGLO_11171 [Colletotrichum gloeosporioides Cg-14]